jgi:hypothetical protein
MPDPNVRLLKAIESLTRSIDENTKQLKEHIRLEKRRSGNVTFRNYTEGENSDENSSSEDAESGTGPYGTGTSQPYS